jgi:hypothetical protein
LPDNWIDGVWRDEHARVHAAVTSKLTSGEYRLSAGPVAELCANGTQLRHEMAIEAATLTTPEGGVGRSGLQAMGLSHRCQLPFKHRLHGQDGPFGYRFIGFRPTMQYLVGEVVRRRHRHGSTLEVCRLGQRQYAHGDYSMISAFLVAHEFDDVCTAHAEQALYVHVSEAPCPRWPGANLRPVQSAMSAGLFEVQRGDTSRRSYHSDGISDMC